MGVSILLKPTVDDSSVLSLTLTELNFLISDNITFSSLLGSVVVHELDQTTAMTGVTTTTNIHARATGQKITFQTGSSAFKQLHADATGGIAVKQDLSSTDGFLHLIFNEGDLVIDSNTTLEATAEDLVLDSSSAIIKVTEPANIRATTHDLWLTRKMEVTRGTTSDKYLDLYVRGTLYGEEQIV